MALIRVKRRAHEDPIDALLLACKKQKVEDPSFTPVFKFAGTVEEKDKDLETHISNVKESFNSENVPLLYKKRQVSDITDKLRVENKLFSEKNRLKVINCFRHGESCGPANELTVIDIENQPESTDETKEADEVKKNPEAQPPSTREQYVYDLYYSNEGDFDDLMMENMLSAHAVDEMLFEFPGQNEDEEDKQVNDDDDDDDSNDENNWRNDYPEEISDNSSVEEGDMILAAQMKTVNIDGEYESDLSSDGYDEDLVYGDDRHHRGHYYCPSSNEDSDID